MSWLLLCAGTACAGDDDGKAKAAPAHTPEGAEDAGTSRREGSGGRPATTAGSAGQGSASGTGGSTHTNGNDPDTEATGTGASGSGGGTAPVTTGNATPPEQPKGSACFGGYAELDRHSAHCGACGHACAPVVRASGLDWPVGIVLDATTAYFITGGNEGKVMSVPLSGGTPTTLAEHQTFPMSIAVDGESVYWASNGAIFKVALGGGTPIDLISTEAQAKGELSAQAITVDAESVYWVHPGTNDLGSVLKMPLAGGDPVTLAMIPGSDPDAITVDATSVYWANGADSSDRAVMKVPLAGGEPVTIASGAHSVYGIAVDAASVYWVAHTSTLPAVLSSTVMKAPLDGGTPTMLATGTAQPMGLAIDGVNVYWTNASSSQTFSATPGTDGTVMAVPRAGGETVTIGPDQEEPGAIAANGTSVCWTLTGMGQGTGMVKCLGACVDSMCSE